MYYVCQNLIMISLIVIAHLKRKERVGTEIIPSFLQNASCTLLYYGFLSFQERETKFQKNPHYYNDAKLWTARHYGYLQNHLGGFHLHLLGFPFVYQFNSRKGVLFHSSFANDQFRRISTTFQHHFKICLLLLLNEKECSFYTHLFCCTEMR